jgi:hypothetical protein
MEAYDDHIMLEGLIELNEERRARLHTKLVHLLKTRAWDLAARQVPPGHA